MKKIISLIIIAIGFFSFQNSVIASDDVTDFSYTGGEQEFIVPSWGIYKIELWGAGLNKQYDSNHKNYFLGAYTSGNIELKKDEKLYFYVGQESVKFKRAATFNGGGQGGKALLSNGLPGTAGSGATDVRLVNGPWKNFDSLKSRIMVAGGGGGLSPIMTVEIKATLVV